jgi:hypothetical protein
MKIKIYAGSSLSKAEALKILPNADYAEPIKRGDIYEAVELGYNHILIVDGLYQDVLAVSPAELMDVLSFGVKLYGSTTMGAIRAAELEAYGMVGVGRIFNEVRNTLYFRDDFLGISQPFSCDSVQPLTYMDIWIGCKLLTEKKKLTQKQMKFILKCYEGLSFSERNLNALSEQLISKNNKSIVNTIAKIPTLMQDLKKQDSLLLLSEVKREVEKIHKWNRIQNLN